MKNWKNAQDYSMLQVRVTGVMNDLKSFVFKEENKPFPQMKCNFNFCFRETSHYSWSLTNKVPESISKWYNLPSFILKTESQTDYKM